MAESMNQLDMTYKGRSQTQLIVSPGDYPAEKWLPNVATNDSIKFYYAFGPEGNTEVVIPKGKILTSAGVEYDVDSEKWVPRVKVAGASDVPFGVNAYNVYQRRRDKFSGNIPSIATSDYIRMPLFVGASGGTSAEAAANSIKYGCVWGDVADPTDKAGIGTGLYGKYVGVDQYGNLTVATQGQIDNRLVVGKIMGVELDMPPAGFLEYYIEMNDNAFLDMVKQSRIVPTMGRVIGSDLDIGTWPAGTAYSNTPESISKALLNYRAGIPFLTDGLMKARTQLTGILVNNATEVLSVTTVGGVTYTSDDGKVTITDPVGAALVIKLKNKLDLAFLEKGGYTGQISLDAVANYPELGGIAQSIVVKINNVAQAAKNIHVNFYENSLVLYFTVPVNDLAVTFDAVVLKSQIPGVPTDWDWKGCYGEARILLLK